MKVDGSQSARQDAHEPQSPGRDAKRPPGAGSESHEATARFAGAQASAQLNQDMPTANVHAIAISMVRNQMRNRLMHAGIA